MIPGIPKADINSYVDWAKLQIKVLIEDHLKEMQSTKVNMVSWARWAKTVKLAVILDPEDVDGAQDIC